MDLLRDYFNKRFQDGSTHTESIARVLVVTATGNKDYFIPP